MTPIRQSVAWWCFVPHLEPDVLIVAAKQIGYVALDLVPPDYWATVRASGLAISSIAGHGSIEFGLNNRQQHRRILSELEQAIKNAAAFGIPNVVCFSGSRAGLSDTDGASICAEALAKIAPIAESAGITLTLELLNSKIDHPDYQADRTDWGITVCQMVASPSVKLLFDIYHMQIMEGDLIRTIQANHQHIAHYHTAGNPGRHELDSSQEISYAAVVKAILKTGYTGFIAHEFMPRHDPITALRQAYLLVQQQSLEVNQTNF